MILDENLFDEIVSVDIPNAEINIPTLDDKPLESPLPGEDNGLADLLLNGIKDEVEAIQGYNVIIANLGQHEEMRQVILDILAEENKHVGQLQKLLSLISPNTEEIQNGIIEASEQLDGENKINPEYSESINEGILTEGKWNHKVPDIMAKNLRKAIDDDNYEVIITTLISIYKYLKDVLPEDLDYSIDDAIEELEFLDISPDADEDEMEEFYEELNANLSNFYDFCDDLKIWIPT